MHSSLALNQLPFARYKIVLLRKYERRRQSQKEKLYTLSWDAGKPKMESHPFIITAVVIVIWDFG